MAASMKFVVPFSVLVMLGGHVSWRTTMPVESPAIAVAIAQAVAPVVASPVRIERHIDLAPVIEIVWACGVLAVLMNWFVRWRKVRAIAHAGSSVDLDFPIPVRSAPALVEPGVFGIFRPVLLLPAGITERLTPKQLRAILTHEACHVRHRDNLTAFLHMLVEATFWFHPLVWWIGTRLVDERERACDEEVLDLVNEPQTYDEGILEICKLYVEAPACVAGVTGANLKKRIEAIMSSRGVEGLSYAKRIALAIAAILAVALPITVGIARAQSQNAADWEAAAGGKIAFEVASVKLDSGSFRPPAYPLDDGNAYKPSAQFSADFPLFVYIQFAYKIGFSRQQREAMLTRLPRWIQEDRYAIEARSNQPPTKNQVRLMMQSLLEDRFGLKVHFESQETAVFALTLAKAGKLGPGLRPHSEGPPCDDLAADQNQNGNDGLPKVFPAQCDVQGALMRPGTLMLLGGRNATMDQLAGVLSLNGQLDRPAVDQTGITGRIDYRFEFLREPNPAAPSDASPEPVPGPTFLEAVHEQLGLKLEPTKAPLRVLMIDSVNRPTEN
jgi:uncharacterized protein (TIGR03435 family)